MTKREFLDKLKKALVNDLSGSVIQENVNYYNDYIDVYKRQVQEWTDHVRIYRGDTMDAGWGIRRRT